jgi:hypothetical protein
MLLFVDESGHDQSGTPCEVLAGVAIAEADLWNLVRAVRAAERDFFGDYLRNFLVDERKAKRLLKSKRFRSAGRGVHTSEHELASLANAALQKGKRAKEHKLPGDGCTEKELVGYSRQVLRFVHEVLNIAARFNVRVFASMADSKAPRPSRGTLRKDYVEKRSAEQLRGFPAQKGLDSRGASTSAFRGNAIAIRAGRSRFDGLRCPLGVDRFRGTLPVVRAGSRSQPAPRPPDSAQARFSRLRT